MAVCVGMLVYVMSFRLIKAIEIHFKCIPTTTKNGSWGEEQKETHTQTNRVQVFPRLAKSPWSVSAFPATGTTGMHIL